MARLNLKTKKEPLIINRKALNKNPGYVAANDPINFQLLKDNRCENEKFSRIDKFFVNHYFQIGTEWLCEKIFYPSPFGIEEIKDEREGKHPLKDIYNKLLNEGIGIIGKRPIANIHKPIQRIQLKCKPKRMELTCKEKD
jgi:hypothetical protein